MRKVTLKNFQIGKFKALVGRSLMATSSLNLTISNEKLESVANSSNKSLTKNWIADASTIFESDPFSPIKLSIVNGGFFVNVIMGAFGDKCNVEFTISPKDDSVVDIKLSNDTLEIATKGAPLTIAYEEIDEVTKKTLFATDTAKAAFSLPGAAINQILGLFKINTSAEKPVNYVQFIGTEGKVVAMDTSFKIAIGEYNGPDFAVKINKSLVNLLDREDHTVYYNAGGQIETFVLESLNPEIDSKTLVALMIDFEDQMSGGEDNFYGSDLNFEEGW